MRGVFKTLGSAPSRIGEVWTEDENAALIKAGDGGEEWDVISTPLGRTPSGCKVQYNALKRRLAGGPPKTSIQRATLQSATAIAREIRHTSPQHRSITAKIFGDPLPGRSALDRLRAGQRDGVRPVSVATGPLR